MHRIFNALRRILAGLSAPEAASDALSALSPREYADLPVYHPVLDN